MSQPQPSEVPSSHAGEMEILLCRFGDPAFNVEPGLGTFKRYFPHAHTVLYTDQQQEADAGLVDEVREVKTPYDPDHPRYGWRCSNLYRAVGLLESKADVAIYTDSDVYVYSDKVLALPELARRFGFCLPMNPRLLVKVDGLTGKDSDTEIDGVSGYCMAYNTTPLAFGTRSERARELLKAYVDLLLAEPVRSTLAFHRAAMKTGFAPFALPFQWCVCQEHVGIGNEIVLHVGHKGVQEYYFGNTSRWLKEWRYTKALIKRDRRWRRLMRRLG